jgi:hypothetical protein
MRKEVRNDERDEHILKAKENGLEAKERRLEHDLEHPHAKHHGLFSPFNDDDDEDIHFE